MIHRYTSRTAILMLAGVLCGCALVRPIDPYATDAARPAVAPCPGRDGPPSRPLPDAPLPVPQTTELTLTNNLEIAATTARTQAEESHRIEREKYDLGKGTIIEVRDAPTNYYRALAALQIARASLAPATGVEP